MQFIILLLSLGAIATIGFYFARRKLLISSIKHSTRPHSLPGYHGWYVAFWCALSPLIILLFWLIFENYILEALIRSYLGPELLALSDDRLGLVINDIKNLANGVNIQSNSTSALIDIAERYAGMRDTARMAVLGSGIALAIAGLGWSWTHISSKFRARHGVERVVRWVLILASFVAVITTIGIVLSVLFESIRFFSIVSVGEFLFGIEWSPQTAIRKDQVGSSGAFGAVPLFTGTLLITLIAMLVAVPIGLF